MFDKCIKCSRVGESCVPNLMLLPFPDLLQWWDKRQKYLGWTNHDLYEKSTVPVGTISRIKAGEYPDCKYSTMKNILLALIGGTKDEFSCTEQVANELKQMEELEKQAAKLRAAEAENERLQARLTEQSEHIAFLMDELKAWRNLHK